MAENLIEGVLIALGGFLASSGGFWVYLRNRSEARDRERDANTRLLMGLAQQRIMINGMTYLERGYVTKDEYEDLRKYLYEPYVELGGNGTAERMMHAVQRLPFRPNNPVLHGPIRRSDRTARETGES